MALRTIFWVALVLIGVAAVFGGRGSRLLRDWLGSNAPVEPRVIHFDNGSVRDPQPGTPAPATTAIPKAGTLRKCLRAGETLYTNSTCPPGSRELYVEKGTVNVVEGGLAKPAAEAGAASEPRRKTVRDVLDMSDSAEMKQKRIDRVVNQ
jgi:hypothetical protein